MAGHTWTSQVAEQPYGSSQAGELINEVKETGGDRSGDQENST